MSLLSRRAGRRLTLAMIAFAIALASFFGLILRDDLPGRFLFGTTWSVVGVWWFGSYLNAKKAPSAPRAGGRHTGR